MRLFTPGTKQSEIVREWHIIDLQDQVLGRAATRIANLLMGKNKSYFVRNLDCGDYVVVINAKDFTVTGNKEKNKVYTRYPGYPGGLHSETLGHLRNRRPIEVIKHAVSGMLPKNKLRDRMMTRLYIYEGAEHPHVDKVKEVQADSK
jgi:large subunit ribosomal protein L13